MRKAICPQPIKRISFYRKREDIVNKLKNLSKVISFLVTIFLISGLPVQAFGETISSGFPALNVSTNGNTTGIFIPLTNFAINDCPNSITFISVRNDKFHKNYYCDVNSSSGFRYSTDTTKSSFNSNFFIFNFFHNGSNF